MQLKGKVVAITGAYKGLGAALAEAFVKKGCRLVLGGRNKDELEKFSAKMKKLIDVVSVEMDARKKEGCERFINEGVRHFGRVDVLVNNAGVLWKLSSIDDVTEEELLDTFETNTFGPIYCAQAAVRVMKKQGTGFIVNIGSTSAIDFKSSHIAYGSSKSAIIGFTGCLREELKGTGINAICISPGGMKTDLFRHQQERDRSSYMDPKLIADKIIENIENPSDEWHIVVRRS